MSLQLSHPLLDYLKLPRTRVILGCLVAISLLLIAFPGIDLYVSRLFYDGNFSMADRGWTRILHASVPWFVTGSLGIVAGTYAFNRLAGRNLWRIDGRKVVYLMLVLAFGAGLVVNAILKTEFGRARPRDIVEFGGTAQFTPAYAISSNCSRNCSFASGDGAGAFFGLAFAAVARRRRAATTAAAGFGVLVSAARIAAGAHFLSDTVVSAFVMLVFSDALHFRMFRFDRPPALTGPAYVPARTLLATVEKAPVRP